MKKAVPYFLVGTCLIYRLCCTFAIDFFTNITTMNNTENTNQIRLWYVYDALCGWCYGFSPVMQRLHSEYAPTLDFEVISGGMIRGSRIGAIGEVAPYIAKAYKDVENRTGVRFGEGFLQGILAEGTAIFTSIPAAMAMAAFKSLQPHNAVAFAHTLQNAIYRDGIEPSNHQAFGKYAEEFGIAADDFLELMLSPFTEERAEAEFDLCARLGITSFPTVLVQQGNQLTMIAQGYTEYDELKNRLDMVLANAVQEIAA